MITTFVVSWVLLGGLSFEEDGWTFETSAMHQLDENDSSFGKLLSLKVKPSLTFKRAITQVTKEALNAWKEEAWDRTWSPYASIILIQLWRPKLNATLKA